MDTSEDKAEDKVGLRCTLKQRQVWASPPHSPGTAAAGMSLSRPSHGPCGIVRTLTIVKAFSLSFLKTQNSFSLVFYKKKKKKKDYR